MATVIPTEDTEGNKIFKVTLDKGESAVALATADTYVDKNIVFNIDVDGFVENTAEDKEHNITIEAENDINIYSDTFMYNDEPVATQSWKITNVDFDLGWSDNYGAVSEVTGSGTTRRTKAVSPQLVPIYEGGKIEVDVSGPTVSAMIFDSDAKLVKTITTFPYEVENKGYVRFKATKSTAITAEDLELLHEGVTVSNLFTKDDGSLVCKEENYSFPRWEDLIYGGTITQDGCRVGNELWFFESSNGETRKILRFDASTFTALPDGHHSLGHMNTASVFDDRLIYHPKHLDETDGSGNKTKLYIYIIDNVSDKIKNEITLTNDSASAIIPITPADPTDRLQWLDTAVWVNKTDIMLFFSAADGNEIHKARLGQNTDGSFDGTYTILHTWKGAPIGQVQGVEWDGDTLWIGTNYGALEALQIAFDNSDYYRVIKRVVAKYPEDQSIYSYAIEPEAVIRCDGYLYMGGSLNHGDGNYNVIGRAEIGDISTHGTALTHEDLVNAPEIQDLSTLRSSFVYAEDARGDIRKISFETLEACFGGGGDPAIVTDGTWDMTGEVAYVPLPEFSASRTAYIEWEGISKYSEISKDTHLLSIKPNGATTGLDVFGISLISGSSASDPDVYVSGVQPRNMPYDSSVVNHGTVSSTVRYLPDSTGQSRALNSTGLIILPDKAINLSNNNEINIQTRTSTGALAAFSGYLYFNAFSADTVSVCPNLEIYTTNEALTNALTEGTLKPGSETLSWKLKKFILFTDEVSYTTKNEIIEHRGEATIDIRFKNGRPFNAGTGGKLIYSDVKGMFPDPEPEPEPDPGLSDEFKEALAAFMDGVAYAIPNGKTLRNNVLVAMGLPIPPDPGPEPEEDVEITWDGTVVTASNLANTDISWSGTIAIIGG